MRKILFTLLAGALLAGCSEDEVPVFGGIYGTIRDAESGLPVYNAEITLSPGNRTTVSGSDGSYEYRNLDAGQYSLSVTATGYRYNSRTVSVVPGDNTLVDMRLTPETPISGIEISTTSLNFDTAYTELSFDIRNTGTSGTIEWSITGVDVPWLTVTPMSGTTDMGKSSSVKVTVDRSALTADATTIFTVNAAGGSKSIMVSVRTKNTGGDGGKDDGGNGDDNGGGSGNNGGGSGDTEKNPVTNGLFGYYTFEGNAKNGVTGSSNGQLTGTSYVTGVQGQGLKLGSSDKLTIAPSDHGMFENLSFSISFWAKDLNDGHIFHSTRTPGSSDSYGDNATALYMSGGQLRFILTCYSNYYEFSHNKYYFSHGTLSGWHMITLVTTVNTPSYGYARTQLYIDGELVDAVSESSSDTPSGYRNTRQFILGGAMDYYNVKANGCSMTIDNLRIYNARALSSSEVMQIYNYEK